MTTTLDVSEKYRKIVVPGTMVIIPNKAHSGKTTLLLNVIWSVINCNPPSTIGKLVLITNGGLSNDQRITVDIFGGNCAKFVHLDALTDAGFSVDKICELLRGHPVSAFFIDDVGTYAGFEPEDLLVRFPEAAYLCMKRIAPNSISPKNDGKKEILPRSTIRDILLINGFTIKEGQTDLKPYVYEAVEELLLAARGKIKEHWVHTLDEIVSKAKQGGKISLGTGNLSDLVELREVLFGHNPHHDGIAK